MQRHASDGVEGRLVSMFSFDAPWDSWEIHPNGHEVVICTAGEITLVQEIDGKEVRTTLRPGEYAINPPGVWHTADVTGRATAVSSRPASARKAARAALSALRETALSRISSRPARRPRAPRSRTSSPGPAD